MRAGAAGLERRGASTATSNERGAAPVVIIGSLVAWAVFALLCVHAFGVVRGGLLGVWGVSIAVITVAGLRHAVSSRLRAREAHGETTLDVLAERELQTV